MRKPLLTPTRIVIAYHPDLQDAVNEALVVNRFMAEYPLKDLFCGSLYDEKLRKRVQSREFDAMIALGGDGTMLRAGRLCAPNGLPVMGINMGHFGFLIEVQKNDWQKFIPMMLEGNYWLEDRMLLHAEHWRDGICLNNWDAINDVVVTRGKFVRPIQVTVEVDNYLLSNYVADGLIVSTATGSTAYAMAVGGPVMPPELRNIMIIPVAPHLSVDRAIILSEGETISIRVLTNHEAVLSVDGASPVEMIHGDYLKASSSDQTVSFVRFQDPGYFYRNLTKYMQRNPSTGGA
jgi:NAD+ kinase